MLKKNKTKENQPVEEKTASIFVGRTDTLYAIL